MTKLQQQVENRIAQWLEDYAIDNYLRKTPIQLAQEIMEKKLIEYEENGKLVDLPNINTLLQEAENKNITQNTFDLSSCYGM